MKHGLNIISVGEKIQGIQCLQIMKNRKESKQEEKVKLYLNANDHYTMMVI